LYMKYEEIKLDFKREENILNTSIFFLQQTSNDLLKNVLNAMKYSGNYLQAASSQAISLLLTNLQIVHNLSNINMQTWCTIGGDPPL